MTNSFVHLHAHSYFSLLEGLIAPRDLVKTAQEFGMNAIALVDHRWMTGAVEFENTCKKAGIQPIYGLEIDINWQGVSGPVVLLALDGDGWSNLCRLSSRLMMNENNIGKVHYSFHELC